MPSFDVDLCAVLQQFRTEIREVLWETPAVRDYVNAPARKRGEPATWTNNNAETMNYVLKTQVCDSFYV